MEYYVYILRSQRNEERFYIGYTTDLKERLKDHANPDNKSYTKSYAPWKLKTYIVFDNKNMAQQFELYLKTQSGRAFLKKRLMG